MDETESEHAYSFPFLQIRKLGFKADLWEITHSTLTSLIYNAQGVCTNISYSVAATDGAGMTSPPRRASFVPCGIMSGTAAPATFLLGNCTTNVFLWKSKRCLG